MSPTGCSQPEQNNPMPAFLMRPAAHIGFALQQTFLLCMISPAQQFSQGWIMLEMASMNWAKEKKKKKNKADVGHVAEFYGLLIA